MGNLVSKMTVPEQTIAPTIATDVVTITDDVVLKAIRIFIVNSGANALTAAALYGSNDKGVNWIAIDGTAFTAAFGTLASAGKATIFEDNLYYDSIKITLTSTSGTKVKVYLTLNHNE